jgi:hypothetical protein
MKTNMKKYIALTMTLLGTVVAGLAQTASGTLTIQGTVASTVSITVAPLGGYNTLDIANGVSAQSVANITEKTNDKNGYTVAMTSLNAGGSGSSLFLKDTAGGSGNDTVPYSLTYNGSTVTFGSGSATLTDVSSRTAQAGVVKALAVTIASSWVNSAAYADTLTFTITGK